MIKVGQRYRNIINKGIWEIVDGTYVLDREYNIKKLLTKLDEINQP